MNKENILAVADLIEEQPNYHELLMNPIMHDVGKGFWMGEYFHPCKSPA